jgi:hypothetical protein
MPNAKALALTLSAYSTPAGRELPEASRYLDALPRTLRQMAIATRPGIGWGYHFDTQTRHLFYPASAPNAVATCFVVGALLDTEAATGNSDALSLAIQSRPFLLSLLSEGGPAMGPYFTYVGTGSELIHNANLLVASVLARLHEYDRDPAAASAVMAATETTLAAQDAAGLWPYGERRDLRWIDNFHTAYILESLIDVERVFGLGSTQLRRGFVAWRRSFFSADGAARFYPDRDYPLEAHSYASAIDCLCAAAAGGDETALDFAGHIFESAVRELWLSELGRFAFKRSRRRLNKREFMRWTNAPMFRAMARLASMRAAA